MMWHRVEIGVLSLHRLLRRDDDSSCHQDRLKIWFLRAPHRITGAGNESDSTEPYCDVPLAQSGETELTSHNGAFLCQTAHFGGPKPTITNAPTGNTMFSTGDCIDRRKI